MRDAEPAEFPPTTFRRLEPRHRDVWIRAAGRWREGHIVKWVRHDNQWVVWAFYKAGRPYWEHAWLVYDPETIRLREDDHPPPGLADGDPGAR